MKSPGLFPLLHCLSFMNEPCEITFPITLMPWFAVVPKSSESAIYNPFAVLTDVLKSIFPFDLIIFFLLK